MVKLFCLMGHGEQGGKGYTNIGSLVYTPTPSKDGSATKVFSASLRSSRRFKGQGAEDEPPQWLKQLELLKELQGEGHHGDDNEKLGHSNEMGEEEDPDFCALQSSNEEISMPAEPELVKVGQWLQEKQGLLVVEEDSGEHEMQQTGKKRANMEISMKVKANMEMSMKRRANMEMEVLSKEIENMEMSRRQYFAALIVAKEKPGEETLALAAGLRLQLQSVLAIHSFSSFDC